MAASATSKLFLPEGVTEDDARAFFSEKSGSNLPPLPDGVTEDDARAFFAELQNPSLDAGMKNALKTATAAETKRKDVSWGELVTKGGPSGLHDVARANANALLGGADALQRKIESRQIEQPQTLEPSQATLPERVGRPNAGPPVDKGFYGYATMPKDLAKKDRAQSIEWLGQFQNRLKTNSILAKPDEYQEYKQRLQSSGLSKQFVNDVISVLPQYVEMGAASMLGGPVAATGAIFAQIFGASYPQYLEKAKGDKDKAFNAAFTNAIAQAPMEKIGFDKIKSIFNPTSAFIKRLRNWVEGGATEFVTEYLQSYPERATERFAEGPKDESISNILVDLGKEVSTGKFQKGALYQGAVGGVAGLFLGSPSLLMGDGKDAPIQKDTATVDISGQLQAKLLDQLKTELAGGIIQTGDLHELKRQRPDMSSQLNAIIAEHEANVVRNQVLQSPKERLKATLAGVTDFILPEGYSPAQDSAQAFIAQDAKDKQLRQSPAGAEMLKDDLRKRQPGSQGEVETLEEGTAQKTWEPSKEETALDRLRRKISGSKIRFKQERGGLIESTEPPQTRIDRAKAIRSEEIANSLNRVAERAADQKIKSIELEEAVSSYQKQPDVIEEFSPEEISGMNNAELQTLVEEFNITLDPKVPKTNENLISAIQKRYNRGFADVPIEKFEAPVLSIMAEEMGKRL